jgi:hypothetical protein
MLPQNQHCKSARLNLPTLLPPPSPQRIASSNTTEGHRQRARGSQRRSKVQRVEEICQFMRKRDITLREFIHVYVTTQGSGGYGERPATRAKRLAKALGEAGDMFSAYQVHRGQEKSSDWDWTRGTAGDGQKLEDYECILGDMKFGDMSKQVNTRAPLLFGLLNGLMAPKIERKDRAPRDPAKFNHRITIITSILCYSRASEGSNKFPRVFGAFLYSNGVKRHILDLFHQFGFCEGYKGVHKHLEAVAEQAEASSSSLSMDVN